MEAVTAEELKHATLLSELPEDALAELATGATRAEHAAGQVIFRFGDPGDTCHIVRKGLIRLVTPRDDGTELVLATMSPGDTFGELAVLDPGPRTASAIAIDRSETILIDGVGFGLILDDYPEAAKHMLGELARSITIARNELADQNTILDLRVKERTRDLHESQLEIIRRLSKAAEFRDDDTGMHITRISRFCATLAKAIGFDDDACELILYAAPMHDIGKIGIPDRVLLKPGKLDPDEWTIMKKHPLLGAEMLDGATSQVMRLAKGIARAHHEKWDGTGYPDGLKAEEIPVMARICAIADVFDALTSERPYKKAWPMGDALDIIQKDAGVHFDPNFAPIFVGLGEDQLRQIRENPGEPPMNIKSAPDRT